MTVGVLEGHALWSATYDSAPNPLLALERRTVAAWLPVLETKTVVDVGCGTGRWAQYARERGAIAVGVDFCEPMLRAAAPGPMFVQGDAVQLPIPTGCADVAICAFTAGYLDSPRRLLSELSRITRRGGLVLVSDVHPAAMKSGWTRSFRHDGEVCEIENRAHAVESFLTAASRRGMALLRIAEPTLGEPEREIFRECGRADRFAAASETRAIFALLWRRL
jgi:ubiquinone/menaquinone biosynthesis C-methylase UbiE